MKDGTFKFWFERFVNQYENPKLGGWVERSFQKAFQRRNSLVENYWWGQGTWWGWNRFKANQDRTSLTVRPYEWVTVITLNSIQKAPKGQIKCLYWTLRWKLKLDQEL